MFEPIAIIGTSCVLPGALSPSELWDRVVSGQNLVRPASYEAWGVDPELVLKQGTLEAGDPLASATGGYVDGFEAVFNPAEFAEDLRDLDPLFQWTAWGVRQALRSTDLELPPSLLERSGLVLGNLGYPSRSMAALTEALVLQGRLPDPRNRFHFALPAQIAAASSRLGLGGYSIDAACASSLYAMKLACDRLHDREADLMIAGGVNRSDDLFLHMGFTALGALSRTGQSRPFHRDADGLVPAEGAAFVVLKRLAEAAASGDPILAVIRGIGCTNDGRGSGLLTPSQAGQVRAMRQAYASANVDPARVSYVECHATGTPVGDTTELQSMAEVFPRQTACAIGSLKSNLGHLITAAGAAGLVKLVEALRRRTLPPTRGCDEPSDAVTTSGFRLLSSPQPWESHESRIAAISAFGFGGNNAHIVVEEWSGHAVPSREYATAKPARPVAIVSAAVVAGSAQDTRDFLDVLSQPATLDRKPHVETLHLQTDDLRFPPRDLEQSLPQQLLMLQVAQRALDEAGIHDRAKAGVFTGIEVDPSIARHGLRWRLAEWLRLRGVEPSLEWLNRTRDRLAPALTPATILGNMPNVCANRLNSQFDLSGIGFAVGEGARSGERALQLALRALESGELDSALVCAADLSCDPVHQLSSEPGTQPADAAVALVLRPLDQALASGQKIIGLLSACPSEDSDRGIPTSRIFGESFAASGLLQVAAAALELKHRARFEEAGPTPWLPARGKWVSHIAGFRLEAAPGHHASGLLPQVPLRIATSHGKRLEGDLAFVFTGAAAAYRGAARDLLIALPCLTDLLAQRFPELDEIAGWLYEPSDEPLSPLQQLYGSSFVSQIHAELTLRILKLRPAAMIGLSSGETNSLFAAGVWEGIGPMLADVASSGMYSREIAGDFAVARQSWNLPSDSVVNWINVRVLASAAQIREAIQNEPRVRLLIIHAPGDCLIGGDAASCRRVIAKLAPAAAYETSGLAVHCPEMMAFASEWRRLHHRPTRAPQSVRIYSNAVSAAYEPDPGTVADMLTRQACETVDLPRTILQAWHDGVRIFIEHGPRNLCASWISQTLGDRPHLAVSLDAFGKSSVLTASRAVEQLVSAGVPLDAEAFFKLLSDAESSGRRKPSSRTLTIAGHPPAFDLAEGALPPQVLQPAPPLPRVVEEPVWPEPVASVIADVTERVSSNGATRHQPAFTAILSGITHAHRSALVAHIDAMRQAAATRLSIAQSAIAVEGPLPARTPQVEQPVKREFSRHDLELHASGQISLLFGPLFATQDSYRHQVRMPQPPLLLANCVTGIRGEPASMQTGSIWTETSIRPDSWFVHEQRICPGVLVEAGQADLFLISWLGVDLLNRGERVYRMLSCELTFFGPLPRVGDKLEYDIHIDEHANLGDVRLFFFHFDCRVNGELRLRMREGQAGFFTPAELAEPVGVIWNPADEKVTPDPSATSLPVQPARRYGRDQVAAFAQGDAYACFGHGYEWLATHSATPRIPNGPLQLIQEIAELDPAGGPWKCGYLRVENRISPSDWFFEGHFKNDPCMPGTLMAEAGMQAISFFMAAIGLTLNKDGWRFEPVSGEPCRLRCRGQVVPSSRKLTYEVFVRRIVTGPEPAVYADILGTVDDNIKAVHGAHLGMRLVPDWPLEKSPSTPSESVDRRPAATVQGFAFDEHAMLASAAGRPSEAFGEMYRRFDGPNRTVRLPSPPYLCMSRVTSVSGPPEQMSAGVACQAEFDVDPEAWFFSDHGTSTMPFSILMEAALQPCGWLASYVGCVSTSPEPLHFRNLDGTATVHGAITPDCERLTTSARLTSLSRSGGITLVSFDVETRAGDRLLLQMKTGFGFFPGAALLAQTGLPTPESSQPDREPSGFFVDLTGRPTRYFRGTARLASGKLLMLDRVTDFWPQGGRAGLGRLWAEKDVDPREWFFKSHFFQDPVMPGSLGVESMIQALQFYCLEAGLDQPLAGARFESLAAGQEVRWKYRGQVIPTARRIQVELEVLDLIRSKNEVVALAEAWLHIDGMRIYHARNLSVRLKGTEPLSPPVFELDPERDLWLNDHRPNYVMPVIPLSGLAALLAQAAAHQNPGRTVVELRNLRPWNWSMVDKPTRFRLQAEKNDDLVTTRLEVEQEPDRFTPAATAVAILDSQFPAPPAPWPDLPATVEAPDPYSSGALPHGPSFHVIRRLSYGEGGGSAEMENAPADSMLGALPMALLDGAMQVIAADEPSRWDPAIAQGQFALPCGLTWLRLYGLAPRQGKIRCEVRFDGMEAASLVAFRTQFSVEGRVWAELRSLHTLFAHTPLSAEGPLGLRSFVRDRLPHPALSLSTAAADGATILPFEQIRAADWLPGSVAKLYRIQSSDFHDLVQRVAIKEHIARRVEAHPSVIQVDDAKIATTNPAEPLTIRQVECHVTPEAVRVTGGEPEFTFSAVRAFWEKRLGSTPEPFHAALVEALCRKFIRRLWFADPEAAAKLAGTPVLFLANHQTLAESTLFPLVAPPVIGTPLFVLAKTEQQEAELPQTMDRLFRLSSNAPETMVYFDQKQPETLPGILSHLAAEMRQGRSVLIHVEGNRALSCRYPVKDISSAVVDVALQANAPIVPVRFLHGLPVGPLPHKTEWPYQWGRQDYCFGTPIPVKVLKPMTLLERRLAVRDAINQTGLPNELETPSPGDPQFAASIALRMKQDGLTQTQAVLMELANMPYGSKAEQIFPIEHLRGDRE